MAIVIVKPASFTKGANHTIKISRAAVQAISKVATDPYFNNVSKWKSIEFHFYGNPENEIEVVKFNGKLSEPSGIFSVSTKSSNNFELSAITIHDFDGGMLVIYKPDFPADASLIFDISFPVELPVTPTLTLSAGVGTIVLSWTPVSQYNDYDIFKKVGAGQFVRIQEEFSDNSYTDTNIVGNTTYTYYITQNWDDDFLLTSNQIVITTIKPAAPVVTPTYVPATSDITIGWNAVPNTQTYFIYRSTAANTFPESTKVAEVISTAPRTYTDATPVPSTTYYYAMRAIGNFASDLSNIASITTVGSFNISQFIPTSQTTASISWTASASATAYKLSYRKVGTSAWSEINNVTSPRSITGLTAGDYEAYIESRNSQSTYISTIVNAEVPIEPAAPLNIAATSWEDSQSSVTWSAAANADRYFIYRSTSQTGVYTKISDTTTLSFLNTGLSNGGDYYYKISAINDAGALSIESPLSAFALGTPNIPTIGISWSSGHPNYAFLASTNAPASMVSKFEIEYFNSAGVKQGTTQTSTSGVTTFLTTSYILGKNVHISAVGKLYVNDGRTFSRAFFGITKANDPTAMTATGGTGITTSWTAGAGNANYSVYRSSVLSMAGGISVGSPSTTSFTDTSAQGDTNFYYAVRGYSGNWTGTPPTGFTYTGHSSSSSDLSNVAGPVQKITPAGVISISDGTSPSSGTATITFLQNDATIQSVRLYRSTSYNGVYSLVNTINNPTMTVHTSFGYKGTMTDSGVTNANAYWYKVQYTKNNGAISADSKRWIVGVMDNVGSRTTSVTGFTTNSVTIAFDGIPWPPSNQSVGNGYVFGVERSTSPSGPWILGTQIGGSTVTPLTVTGLTENTLYYFRPFMYWYATSTEYNTSSATRRSEWPIVSATPKSVAYRDFSSPNTVQSGETLTWSYLTGGGLNMMTPDWHTSVYERNLSVADGSTLSSGQSYVVRLVMGYSRPALFAQSSMFLRIYLGGTTFGVNFLQYSHLQIGAYAVAGEDDTYDFPITAGSSSYLKLETGVTDAQSGLMGGAGISKLRISKV